MCHAVSACTLVCNKVWQRGCRLEGWPWFWIIIAVVVLGISAYFGNEYRLDRKAHKLNSGSEEERRLAAEMQEIARKIDEGKYLYR